ncbi:MULTISPECIES: YjgB family protein [Bacillales]|uniref:YjgB family protein n=1 Tax=Bacillales TaxID=1385 RepID=UPI0006A7766A|nr:MULTISPECIES: YjgB family protein [Bacillales]OBZ12418.1 hypothetical protein A7975_15450 [Bacillus sp. FJAT-26390]
MLNQTKRFKQFAVGISFAIALSLTACSNNETSADPTPPPATEAPSEQPSPKPSQQPSETAGSGNAGQEVGGTKVSELISSIYDSAKVGKVPGSSYAAHETLFDDIEAKWGKADSSDSAGKGIYATYKDKGFAFGYNKGMIVFDVRSYADELHAITLKDMEIALGSAEEKTVNGTDEIYTYQVNKQYQLKFIIPEATGKVDHISVYSPADTKNNMAG